MNKKTIGVIAIVLIVVIATGTYFGLLATNQTDYTSELQTLLNDKFEQYCADKSGFEAGNITLKITSPNGDDFVSTAPDGGITENTHFRAASLTKTFTGAAILMLHQEGKIDINDTITSNIPGTETPYVPDTANYDIPYKNQITIKQLLTNRAGVFDVSNTDIPENVSAPYAGERYIEFVKEDQPNHTFTFDELVGVVASNQLSYFPPGTAFHYSNTGIQILAEIIERTSGMSYAEYVKQNLLEPNGLTETSFPSAGTDQQLPEPYAEGYVFYEGEIYQTTIDNMSPNIAEGNVISTVNDLDRWITLLYSAEAGVNADLVAEMMKMQVTGEEHVVYGMCTEYAEGLGYGHNGAHAGYMTVARYDPQTKTTVTMFATIWNAENIQGQLEYMYDIGRSAKQILGYS